MEGTVKPVLDLGVLKALADASDRLPNLIKPLFGSKLAANNNVLRMSALLERAPQLQKTRTHRLQPYRWGREPVSIPGTIA